MAEGTKHDQGKPRLELLDPLFLTEVAKVLTFGAKKYSAHNWRGGLQVSRLIGACMRHLQEFQEGNDTDPETEHTTQHLAHAACNLMFALRMLKDRPDLDDRYKPKAEPVSPEKLWYQDGVLMDPQPTDKEIYESYRSGQRGWMEAHLNYK